MNLKYIVLQRENGTELPFLFSADITHADFLKGVQYTPVGYWKTCGRNWNRGLAMAKCIAGGFFNGTDCHGSSESIGIKSRGAVDTALFVPVTREVYENC